MSMDNGRTRAPNGQVRLTDEMAAIAKGMLLRGDRQHDIAAWFGVNGGRIGEISTGKTFAEVEPIQKNLPPPGPYISVQSGQIAKQEIAETIDQLVSLAAKLEERMAALT